MFTLNSTTQKPTFIVACISDELISSFIVVDEQEINLSVLCVCILVPYIRYKSNKSRPSTSKTDPKSVTSNKYCLTYSLETKYCQISESFT